MTPAGVGKILPDDSKTALIRLFTQSNSPDLLASQAQGAEGNIPQHHSRPDFFGWIFQVAPGGKSKFWERRQARPTPLAARLYRLNFNSDEPPPTNQQVPSLSGSLDVLNSGTQLCQNEACHCY